MVKQTLIISGIGDISGIRLVCRHCESHVVLQTTCSYKMPSRCPVCDQLWRNEDTSEFLRYLRLIARSEDLPVTVQFEINGDDED